MKLTVPVAALGVTVAVKVTDCPWFDGFGLEARVVAVAAALTVWETGEEVEPP
jgi:hypothetical protein